MQIPAAWAKQNGKTYHMYSSNNAIGTCESWTSCSKIKRHLAWESWYPANCHWFKSAFPSLACRVKIWEKTGLNRSKWTGRGTSMKQFQLKGTRRDMCEGQRRDHGEDKTIRKITSIIYNMHIYCCRQITVLVYTLNPLLLQCENQHLPPSYPIQAWMSSITSTLTLTKVLTSKKTGQLSSWLTDIKGQLIYVFAAVFACLIIGCLHVATTFSKLKVAGIKCSLF